MVTSSDTHHDHDRRLRLRMFRRGMATFRALRYRNYRLFFSGQLISMIGTWLTRVASAWLVYDLSHSAMTLGIVSFAGQLPTFLLAPVAGVLVDRLNRHRVLVVTQGLAMLQPFLLALLTLMHWITIPHIMALSIFQGVINAFDMPVRQTFVPTLVEDRADLPNAIALNSSMVNVGRLLGPSLAGILIATIGVGGCFVIDTLSYAAVLASLMAMRLPRHEKREGHSRKIVLAELKTGFQYVAHFPPIRALLLLLALASLVAMPYTVLLPVIATDNLNGGAHTLGYLSGAAGAGALAGALYLAARKTVRGLGKVVAAASLMFGVGLIGLGLSRILPLSLACAGLAGLGMILLLAAVNTLLQTLSDEDKRGRVMSYYTMAIFGTAPFGSLLAGAAGEALSAAAVLTAGGLACIAAGLWFLRELPDLRQHVLPVYRRLGIVPELATGLEKAAEVELVPEP